MFRRNQCPYTDTNIINMIPWGEVGWVWSPQEADQEGGGMRAQSVTGPVWSGSSLGETSVCQSVLALSSTPTSWLEHLRSLYRLH